MTTERTETMGPTQPTTRSRSRRARLGAFAALAALLAAAPGARWIAPAHALPADTTPMEERAAECIGGVTATLTVSPTTVNLGQSYTVTWKATLPAGCAAVQIYLNSAAMPAAGFRTIQALATTGYTLRAQMGKAYRTLANRSIQVILPPTVTISSNTVKPLLLQALREGNHTIIVQDNVDMDLTDWNGPLQNIPIASGTILRGGRTSRDPGPRLYTTSRPGVFFFVSGDNIRITGLRIQGPDMGVVDGDENNARGIVIRTPSTVEIDNNELSGWCWAAVQVRNGDVPDGFTHPEAVRVHDNWIHHNQHSGGNGYGVAVADGAWAKIERNVFDWNRHAVTGEDGSDGSGYEANENLVLQHGGLHRWIPFPGFWVHTHQFDMHGQSQCGAADIEPGNQANCGTAGHSAFVRRNTFLYIEDEDIKLRGTPQLHPFGFFVEANVFAYSNPDDAITQNESGMFVGPDNQFGVNGMSQLGSCDFDGDGVNDSFLATGATWWFSSGGTMPWTFLRASTARLSDVTLGNFVGDSRCDVKVGSAVYNGGTTVAIASTGIGGGAVLAR